MLRPSPAFFRTKDAKPDVLRLGKQRSEELQNVLTNVYLRRDKSVCLEDDLPTKYVLFLHMF
jgi:hypothetical protein